MSRARDVAIVGVYTTAQERASSKTTLSITMEAIFGALDDAGMSIKDIDGYFGVFPAGNGLGGGSGNVAYQFNIPIHHYSGNTGSGALIEAAALIRAGLLETAIITIGSARPTADGGVVQWTRPTNEFTEWTGAISTMLRRRQRIRLR